MSIAISVRGRRPATKVGPIRRSGERPSGSFPTVVESGAMPVTGFVGVSFLAHAVQTLVGRSRLQQGAVGGLFGGKDAYHRAAREIFAVMLVLARAYHPCIKGNYREHCCHGLRGRDVRGEDGVGRRLKGEA